MRRSKAFRNAAEDRERRRLRDLARDAASGVGDARARQADELRARGDARQTAYDAGFEFAKRLHAKWQLDTAGLYLGYADDEGVLEAQAKAGTLVEFLGGIVLWVDHYDHDIESARKDVEASAEHIAPTIVDALDAVQGRARSGLLSEVRVLDIAKEAARTRWGKSIDLREIGAPPRTHASAWWRGVRAGRPVKTSRSASAREAWVRVEIMRERTPKKAIIWLDPESLRAVTTVRTKPAPEYLPRIESAPAVPDIPDVRVRWLLKTLAMDGPRGIASELREKREWVAKALPWLWPELLRAMPATHDSVADALRDLPMGPALEEVMAAISTRIAERDRAGSMFRADPHAVVYGHPNYAGSASERDLVHVTLVGGRVLVEAEQVVDPIESLGSFRHKPTGLVWLDEPRLTTP